MGWRFGLATLVLVTIFSRLAYLGLLGDYIGADEAVGGLMALKISRGEDFPLVVWEAHYAGTLLSYLGAFLFLFLEPSPFIFRVTALPLALVGITAVAAAARALWGVGPALAAAFWLAVGPPLLFAVSGQAIGGYPEVLAFGGLTLWLGIRFCQRLPRDGVSWEWGLLGAVGGFGTYSLALVFPVFAGTLWALWRHRGGLLPREWGYTAAGFFLGFSPFLLYNVTHGGASVLRLAGRVLDVSTADLSHGSILPLVMNKGIRYLLRLLWFPWAVVANLPSFLGLSRWETWAAALAVAGGLPLARSRRDLVRGTVPESPREKFGLALLGRCGLATLLFVWILGLDMPRHLSPFYLLAPLGLAVLWKELAGWRRVVGWGALGLLLVSNIAGTTHEARTAEPRVAGLLNGLHSRDIKFAYTDYFIAYPLIFLSRETILASPEAGPVNVERRPAYTEAVAASSRPAYVFRRNTEASAVFVREMRQKGHAFRHESIDEFDLYVPDRHIHPNELALLRQF